METTMTLAQLAGEASSFFERRSRGDDTIVALRDDAPEWLGGLVREAHGDMLPDDWRYRIIERALSHVHENNLPTVDEAYDTATEFADDAADTYSHDRLQWLASNLNRAAYCDMAAEKFGRGSEGIIEMLGAGQYMEASEIYNLVVAALEERRHALETETV